MAALCLLLAALPASAQAPQVLYNARITTNFANSSTSVYAKPDKDSAELARYNPGHPIQIVEVLPNYVGILLGGRVGWVLRHRIMDPVPVDPRNTPRFGTVFNRYFATVEGDVPVRAEPDSGSKALITLTRGAKIAFLDISDGWARTIFKRQYGYVDTRLLPELEMTAPTEEAGTEDIPIAVYNSFYDISDNENNINRISNLKVGAARMSRTLQPGEKLDFNGDVGPFSEKNGFKPAGGLVDG